MKTLEIMLGSINPAALPALRIAGALFLIVNLVGGAYIWRYRRKFFGPDSTADGDRTATRELQVMVLSIPWLVITGRILYVWVGLWIH